MFFAHVKGLGFMRFLNANSSCIMHFVASPLDATKWKTVQDLKQELNGEINDSDLQIFEIKEVK